MNPTAPPLDLHAEFIPGSAPCLLIKWTASCRNIPDPLGYKVRKHRVDWFSAVKGKLSICMHSPHLVFYETRSILSTSCGSFIFQYFGFKLQQYAILGREVWIKKHDVDWCPHDFIWDSTECLWNVKERTSRTPPEIHKESIKTTSINR